MFQIAHAYIASEVLHSDDPETIVGAILPDGGISGLGTYVKAVLGKSPAGVSGITFSDMHPSLQAMSLQQRMDNKSVARGILTHSVVDIVSHGSDSVSKENYNWRHESAYSFGGEDSWWGRRFPKLQVNSHSLGMLLHNFAEVELDAYVAQTYPETVELLLNAVQSVSVREIGKDLARAIGKNPQAIISNVEAYLRATSRFARIVEKMPRVNDAGLELVLRACIQKCKEKVS